MKKLNVLFITEYLPPQINGIAIRCYNYIINMRNLGHNIYVAGPDNCHLTTIPLLTFQSFFNKDNRHIILDYYSSSKILNLIDKIDVVHCFYPINISAIILFPFFQMKKIPVICSHHCEPSQIDFLNKKSDIEYLYYYKDEIKNFIYSYFKLFNYKELVTLNLVPSITKNFSKIFNYLEIIPSGIDTKLFNYNNIDFDEKSKSKILVYVGRLSPEKNCDTMINYFNKLITNDEFKDYRLIIIGGGPSKKYLENDINKNIEFLGYVNHEDITEYYKKAQAFVTFSTTEAFGFTLIEALATSTPILYPKCTVFDSLYKKDFKETRFNIKKYNSFEKAVAFTYCNVELQQKAIDYCKDKDWDSATKKLIEIYLKEINKKKLKK